MECWKSLLESSKVQLTTELKNKLKEANITESKFSQRITKVYLTLLRFDMYEYFQSEPARREDIISIMAALNLDDELYKSVQILFNLEEPE